jgi:hypothetical protein
MMSEEAPYLHYNNANDTFHTLEQIGPPVHFTVKYRLEIGGEEFEIDHNSKVFKSLHLAITDFIADTNINNTNLASYFLDRGELVVRKTITKRQLQDGTEISQEEFRKLGK